MSYLVNTIQKEKARDDGFNTRRAREVAQICQRARYASTVGGAGRGRTLTLACPLEAKEGKATVLLYLSSVARVLEDFTYHRQFVGDHAVVLEFSAHVGSMSLKGVDILQFNDAGQISEFEVMVRPANGLQALGAAMAQQLAQRKFEKESH